MSEERQKVNSTALNAGQLEAMQYRYEGYEYTQISQKLKEIGYNVEVHHIKYWFSARGPLRDLYRKFVEEERFVRLEQARDMYSAYADQSMRTMIALMTDTNPMVRFMASKTVQERLFGDPKKRTFASDDEKNDDPVSRILREYKVIDENDNIIGNNDTKLPEGQGSPLP